MAAIGLSLPPAVHKYGPFLFRRPGFNPTVLIRVSSQPHSHFSYWDFEESCGATMAHHQSPLAGRPYARGAFWISGVGLLMWSVLALWWFNLAE